MRCQREASVHVLSQAGAGALLLLANACTEPNASPATPSAVAASEADSRAPAELKFACDEGASAQPSELRRLTMTQYRNTVRDLTLWLLGDASDAEVVLGMVGLERVPTDRREPTPRSPHGSYRRLDQALEQAHVDETYRVASALADLFTAPARLAVVVGPCAVDADLTNDEACLSSFLQRFGARALRRPLAAEDAQFYRTVYGSDPTVDRVAYADVISVMLSAPEFLYFVEHGERAVLGQPGSYELSPYEFAARLSYHFWQTSPDDALWRAAQDGSLLEPSVLTGQVERLIADARTRATISELFSDLLELESLPALDAYVTAPSFLAFAGGDLPGPQLREHVIDEALDMVAYYTWTAPGGVAELFTSSRSFARSEDLARIYGVAPWDGSSAPPLLPAGERVGLLTHAWFLVSGSQSSRPIQRGAFVRRQLLCDELSPPPAKVDLSPPAPRSDQTTRQIVEALTEQPGSACASCHASAINPLGFAFEGFDALGRVRNEQRLFSDDGVEAQTLPIDTTTVPRIAAADESVSNGPADLTGLLLQSGKLEACLARHYFRFTFGRYEDLARDGCVLERLRTRLVESGRIRDMIAEVAALPALRQRSYEPPP